MCEGFGCPYWDGQKDICLFDGPCIFESNPEELYPHMCGEPYDSDYREIESCDYREDFRY